MASGAPITRRTSDGLSCAFDDPRHVERYRFFILATQSPDGYWSRGTAAVADDMMTITAEILRKTMCEYPANQERVYLSGVSGGGDGCWEMVMGGYPEFFAAVVPMGSGGGDVYLTRQSGKCSDLGFSQHE